MNVSSDVVVLPTIYRRRFASTTATRTPMFIDASPVAVSNKIKAIQARKTRLNPLTTDSDYTDIRPFNFGYTNSIANTKENMTVLTAEKLFNRNKDIRLDRIPNRRLARPSVLSTTSINQQSLLWQNYQQSAVGNKQIPTHSNSTTVTPPPPPPAPPIGSIKNKSPGGKMLEIPRRRNHQSLIDQQTSPRPIDLPQKPLIKSPRRTFNNNFPINEIQYDNDTEREEIVMDKEFEQYLEKAIVKCADWLLKYIFNEEKTISFFLFLLLLCI